jgi:DUF4097 and DUF4098 domain-containing protein YvlB
MASRGALIALLIAVEVAIVAVAVYSMSGAHAVWAGTGGGGFHHYDFTAKPIAPITAGSTPHIVVSDPDDRIMVTASTDGQVHIQDLKAFHGTYWGTPNITPLTVEKTADGVSISRPEFDSAAFGVFVSWSVDRVAIQIPAGSTLEIQRSSGSNITGINGDVTTKSDDGSITLATLRGNVDAESSDGHVSASDIKSDTVKLQSDDGYIEMHDVVAGTLDARTDDGHITVDGLQVTGNTATIHSNDGQIHVNAAFATGNYEVSSDDGHIDVTVGAQSNLTVAATTGDGRITRDGQSFHDDGDSTSRSFTLGGGSGHLNINSHDGSISITTNGAN